MPYKDPVKQREYNRNYQRHRYHDSPEVRARQREYRLRTRFDMSVERYDELHDEQSGVCAICGEPCSTGSRLAVDHDHETGDVRGLMCRDCNIGLGLFKDSISALAKAIEYLNKA